MFRIPLQRQSDSTTQTVSDTLTDKHIFVKSDSFEHIVTIRFGLSDGFERFHGCLPIQPLYRFKELVLLGKTDDFDRLDRHSLSRPNGPFLMPWLTTSESRSEILFDTLTIKLRLTKWDDFEHFYRRDPFRTVSNSFQALNTLTNTLRF